MSSQFYSNRIGIESLTPAQMKYWKDQGKTYRPILEYRPLTKEEEDRLNKEYYEKNNRVGYEKLYSAVKGNPFDFPFKNCLPFFVEQHELARSHFEVSLAFGLLLSLAEGQRLLDALVALCHAACRMASSSTAS